MLVRDFMSTKLVTISVEDPLSKALSKMQTHKVHQLLVVDGKQIKGMVFLKDLIFSAREIEQTKVRRLMRYVPTLKPSDNLETVARKLIESGLRSIPVEENGKLIGIVSETDVINNLRLPPIQLPSYAAKPVTIGASDSIAKAVATMRRRSISRLVVIDRDRKLMGMLDVLTIASVFKPKESMRVGFRGGEKSGLEQVKVRSFLRPTSSLPFQAGINEILSGLRKYGDVVFVDEENRPIGILTPKQVISAYFFERRNVDYQLIGFDEIPENFLELARQIITRTMDKFSRVWKTRPRLIAHLDIYDREGRVKYSIHASISSDGQRFYARAVDWKFIQCVKKVCSKLERQLKKKKRSY